MASISAGDTVRVGIDIGGTFTDLAIAFADSRLFIGKVSTTPGDPGEAVIKGLQALLARLDISPSAVSEIVHGTTVGSNTILQRVGARMGLVTTKGFRDVLEIGRIRTPDMFNLAWEKPEPLVHRRHRREVSERMAADGTVIVPLDIGELLAVAHELVAEDIEAIAICFLNSYTNSAHEEAAASALRREFPNLHVTASFEVLPELKEYERTSTTVVNGYLLPAINTYLAKLTEGLKAIGVSAPLQVMASNGGMMGARMAAGNPVYAVASGPAGGIVGAASVGSSLGFGDLIVFDMGGTTAKASIIENGKPSLVSEYEFRDGISSPSRFIKGGGYMLKVPAVDIAEVGAGGGSIAAMDAGGLLRVGPQSAGADPGPACYGRGNDRPTVTDANMCLGYLNPQALAGGSLPVAVEKSRDAVYRHIAQPLGIDIYEAARGIRQIANVNMARAIRSVTVERGKDPRDMTLVAIGGGGPLHAVDVARLLQIRRVVVPIVSGVFSAAGMLSANIEHNFVRFALRPLKALDPAWLRNQMEMLAGNGRQTLAEEGYHGASVQLRFSADLRYVGQSSELTIPIDAEIIDAGFFTDLVSGFQHEYHQTYGYATNEPIEFAALRLTAIGWNENRFNFANAAIEPNATKGARGSRQVSFGKAGEMVETPLFSRSDVAENAAVGPAVIESYDTTIVVPPGCRYRADATGNIIIETDLEEAGGQTDAH